ncbi:MAG: cobalamin B12-binding domain-containing protein, partial [Deltaproteobacteria bacterium]|nr:cobalamin B12-binding domain-containing protein [Deltaproteobacteria bacterium]
LAREREQAGSIVPVCEQIGAVLDQMGERWRSGQLSVIEEHLAIERLTRGLARACDDIDVDRDAPAALLVTAEGEEHTIGLALAELILREAGWSTRWSGRRTPLSSIRRFVSRGECKLLAVAASGYARDRVIMREQARELARVCEPHRVHLILGGSGAWPDELSYGHRVSTYGQLATLARALDRTLPLASEK